MTDKQNNAASLSRVELLDDLNDFFTANITGYTQQQWNLAKQVRNAVDNRLDTNQEVKISKIADELQIPYGVARDAGKLSYAVDTYNNLLRDVGRMTGTDMSSRMFDPETSEAPFMSKYETKLFGGLHENEYQRAYLQERGGSQNRTDKSPVVSPPNLRSEMNAAEKQKETARKPDLQKPKFKDIDI